MTKQRLDAIDAAWQYLVRKKATNKPDTLVLGRNVIFWRSTTKVNYGK